MSEKVKAIKGSKERAKEVKQWLVDHGAQMNIHTCDNSCFLYFVREDNKSVDFVSNSDAFLFDVEELSSERWRSSYSKMYYYISDSGKIFCTHEFADPIDDERYEIGNYFETEADAEEVRNIIIELLKSGSNE